MARPRTSNQRLNGFNPLSYLGDNPTTPTNFTMEPRVPTTSDYDGFLIGDQWLNTTSMGLSPSVAPTAEDMYVLVAKLRGVATWVNYAAGATALETLTGNDGLVAVGDASDNINIKGDGTSLTVTRSPDVNSLLISPGSYGTPVTKLHTQDGNDVTQTLGVINVSGAHGLNTTGTVGPNTVTVAIDNAITLGDLSAIAANSGALTATTGDVIITAGDLTLPNTNTVGNQGIIKFGGNRFISNFGTGNTFVGAGSGNTTTTSQQNVGIGTSALAALTTGGGGPNANVAVGYHSLMSCTNAGGNVAIGADTLTLFTNGTGVGGNVAVGWLAGYITLGELNVIVGDGALQQAAGAANYNVVLGYHAGYNYTTTESHNVLLNNDGTLAESNSLRIGMATGTGNQQLNKAFIHGIRGITTANADAIAVLIDSAGQLGTVSSSIRYKTNIEDMADATDKLLDLRPVTFDYIEQESDRRQYGLIAEEVDEIMPDLVVYDAEGIPSSVRYHEIPVMLLNEIKKLKKRIELLESR